MQKIRSLVLVVVLAISALCVTSVFAQDNLAPVTVNVSVAHDAIAFGQLSVGNFNGEAFCALTVRSLPDATLSSKVPFTVQAGDINNGVITLQGARVPVVAEVGFGVTDPTLKIGPMPVTAPANTDSIIFWAPADVSVMSGTVPVARVWFDGVNCALIFAQPVKDLMVSNVSAFTLGAGVYTPSISNPPNVGGLTVNSWDNAVNPQFGSAFQVAKPEFPDTVTNVNAIVISSQHVAAASPTPAFGVVNPAVPTAIPVVPVTVVPAIVGSAVTPVPANGAVVPMTYPVPNQWMFQNLASTNTMMVGWQQVLVARGPLDPAHWVKVGPNVNNPAVHFVTANSGMTLPEGDHTYGEAYDTVSVNNAGRSIRLITADYNLTDLGVECHAENGIGCALILINVNDTAHTFENQIVKNGWSIEGTYHNGNDLGTTVWAAASYLVAHMMNFPGAGPDATNEGGNCSSASGCTNGVLVTVVDHSAGAKESVWQYLYTR